MCPSAVRVYLIGNWKARASITISPNQTRSLRPVQDELVSSGIRALQQAVLSLPTSPYFHEDRTLREPDASDVEIVYDTYPDTSKPTCAVQETGVLLSHLLESTSTQFSVPVPPVPDSVLATRTAAVQRAESTGDKLLLGRVRATLYDPKGLSDNILH